MPHAALIALSTLILAASPLRIALASGPFVVERAIQPSPEAPERIYLTAEPSDLEPGAPAVVLLHGGGQSMTKILEPGRPPRRWLALAETYGFLLIVPNGFNTSSGSGAGDAQSWNDLRSPSPGVSEQDDVAFIDAILDAEIERHELNPAAIFVTGSSNGGMMALRLAIERSTSFAGAVAFIASLPEETIPAPAAPIPVALVNGDADPLMPWDGGPVGVEGAPVRSTLASLAYWQSANDAAPDPDNPTFLPDLAPGDGTRILRFQYHTPEAPGPTAILYRVAGGGHAIPVLESDAQIPLPVNLIGVQSRDARGVDLAWRFFQTHLPPENRSPDLTRDAVVDAADLAMLIASWNQPGPTDLTGDGTTGAADLAALIAAWGGI